MGATRKAVVLVSGGLDSATVLAAAVAGAALALSGPAFQVLLRNPLASPWVLGVSGGARCW